MQWLWKMGFLFVNLNLNQDRTRKIRDLNQKPPVLPLQQPIRYAELLNTKMNFRCKLFHWVTNSTSDISTNPNPKALPTILQHTASFCSNYPSSALSLPLPLTTVRATEQSVLKL